jgi:hypothetical protein
MRARFLVSCLLVPCVFGLLIAACSSDAPNDDPPLETCNAIADYATFQHLDLQVNARRACDVNEDCVVVHYALSCGSACKGWPAAVARATEPDLAASVQAVDDRNCPDFFRRGCRVLVSGCGPAPSRLPVAVCDDGVCMLEYVEL